MPARRAFCCAPAAALADLRATTSSLLTVQSDQFNTVLQAALREEIPEAIQEAKQEAEDGERPIADRADALDADALAEEILTRLTARLPAGSSRFAFTKSRSPSRLALQLGTYPDRTPESEEAVEALEQLSKSQLMQFRRIAESAQNRGMSGSTKARFHRRDGGIGRGALELADRGLITVVNHPPDGESGFIEYSLTPLGAMAARLLLPTGDRPAWIPAFDK